MEYTRKIIESVVPPQNKEVLWVDLSIPRVPVVKLYLDGRWTPLIADRLIKQLVTILPNCYVRGSDGAIVYSDTYSVAEVTIEPANRLYFLGTTRVNNSEISGYAFYNQSNSVIESYTWPFASALSSSSVFEITTRVPNETTTFRTTLLNGITESNFYCNISALYIADIVDDSSLIKYGTTSYWTSQTGYVPQAGEIIIYSDYEQIIEGGTTINIPGIKIGSGNGFVQDLAFVGTKQAQDFLAHLADTVAHTTLAEKTYWNNKLNINDNMEVDEFETLIFNRD